MRRCSPVAIDCSNNPVLRAQAAAGHIALDELVASYLHMQVNRLLRSAQREQELVLYELLIRHYQAQRAQGK